MNDGIHPIRMTSTAGSGWTFVLEDVSLGPGNSGAASGYAIGDDREADEVKNHVVIGDQPAGSHSLPLIERAFGRETEKLAWWSIWHRERRRIPP